VSVAFVAGTTAEVIKLAPVMRAMLDRGDRYELWNTAYHVDSLSATLKDLNLPEPDLQLIPVPRQRQVVHAWQVPGWAARLGLYTLRHRRALRRRLLDAPGKPLVVVHGDTFTTVLGSFIGRFLRFDTAHIEAGQRSGNLGHPLPEEFNRRVAAKVVNVHYAPGPREVENLRAEKAKGALVDTGANTVIDALRLMMSDREPPVELPEVFGLVTLHRFEMLRNAEAFTTTLRVLHEASKNVPIVMVAGSTERARIAELALSDLFDDRFRIVEKVSYAQFLPILGRASFVVTDSGGLQQECQILGLPCAIQRKATESHQGLGQNLVLTELDPRRLEDFLGDWQSYRRPSQLDQFNPTEVILGHMREAGYLPR
jgi:UDP-N-acetylglucosamine 2-epimerase (non-hydrolysing)